MSSSRFKSPTSDFDLAELVRRLRRGLLLSLAVAVGLTLVLVALNPFRQVELKAPRPLSTKFIKREPRLTKPLELRKIPKPKRQLARRQVHLAAARLDQVQATTNFNVRSLISSHVGNSGISLFKSITDNATNSFALEPKLVSTSVTSTRMPEHKIDMALEMLDVNSMDTGRYRAMVVQDVGDPQAIKGFIKIAHVISARGVTDQMENFSNLNLGSIEALCDVINEYTGLKAEFIGTITYDDIRLLELPILIPQGSLNEGEMENYARYMMSGGFIMGGYHSEALIKYGGLVPGYDFWSERLLPDHPIFNAFFSLEGGTGGHIDWRDIVTGYFIRGRMVGIGGVGWGSDPRRNQMAVNVIIYALTQEGSITQRLMQGVN